MLSAVGYCAAISLESKFSQNEDNISSKSSMRVKEFPSASDVETMLMGTVSSFGFMLMFIASPFLTSKVRNFQTSLYLHICCISYFVFRRKLRGDEKKTYTTRFHVSMEFWDWSKDQSNVSLTTGSSAGSWYNFRYGCESASLALILSFTSNTSILSSRSFAVDISFTSLSSFRERVIIPCLSKLGKASAKSIRWHFGKQSTNPLVY